MQAGSCDPQIRVLLPHYHSQAKYVVTRRVVYVTFSIIVPLELPYLLNLWQKLSGSSHEVLASNARSDFEKRTNAAHILSHDSSHTKYAVRSPSNILSYRSTWASLETS